MAQKQRGATVPQTDMEKKNENFSLTLDSSEDEAPEEETFEDSKARALRSMKQALDTARREKELLKEKRRKRQELFQEQKKRKLLSAEVLEEIDSAPSKKQKQDEAEEEREEGEDERKETKQRKSGKRAHIRDLKGNYTVKTLREQTSVSFQQRTAEDFLRSRMYGLGSCRTTSNELLSLQNKKGSSKSAAVQFVKKDWACDKKSKAEKVKKRWMHKQQIPS